MMRTASLCLLTFAAAAAARTKPALHVRPSGKLTSCMLSLRGGAGAKVLSPKRSLLGKIMDFIASFFDPAFGGVYASEEQAPRTRIPGPEELHCHPMHPDCNPCIQAATHASSLQPHAQAVTPCILRCDPTCPGAQDAPARLQGAVTAQPRGTPRRRVRGGAPDAATLGL